MAQKRRHLRYEIDRDDANNPCVMTFEELVTHLAQIQHERQTHTYHVRRAYYTQADLDVPGEHGGW
jgi:hypothetical protein